MLNIIKSSLNANMRGISLVSNNIANSNTTAFKKSYSNFSDIYSKNISDNPKGFSGMGVINDSPRKQMFQGPLKQTDGALDLAVSGLGFLTLASSNNSVNNILKEILKVNPAGNSDEKTPIVIIRNNE